VPIRRAGWWDIAWCFCDSSLGNSYASTNVYRTLCDISYNASIRLVVKYFYVVAQWLCNKEYWIEKSSIWVVGRPFGAIICVNPIYFRLCFVYRHMWTTYRMASKYGGHSYRLGYRYIYWSRPSLVVEPVSWLILALDYLT
jgi:hypothetical protein